jgi:threonine synthase
MNYHFRCTLCGDELDPDTTRYVCPKHGDPSTGSGQALGILDTILDYKTIAAKTSPRKISDSRDFSIWRYADLLPIDDALKFAPPLQVGWTPLYRATKAGAQLGLSRRGTCGTRRRRANADCDFRSRNRAASENRATADLWFARDACQRQLRSSI